LWWLDLSRNQISNLLPLSNLTGLAALYLGSNQISNLAPMSTMTGLEDVILRNNQISDIAPLAANPGLATGDYLDLRGNPLNAAAYDTHLPDLEGRGVDVYYDA
jgi:Leucine-rich repeat (LRR) protein